MVAQRDFDMRADGGCPSAAMSKCLLSRKKKKKKKKKRKKKKKTIKRSGRAQGKAKLYTR